MSPPPPIRTVIADDEPPARRRVRALLEREADVEIVAECRNGRETVEAVVEHAPALLFLDVQMPEGSGFDVLAEIGPERAPVVVFVTAYDEFALRAFEVHALDYLLKPYDQERFRTALQRARTRLRREAGPADPVDRRLRELIDAVRDGGGRYLRRVPVRSGGRIRFLEIDEVSHLEAEGNYVRLHTVDRSYLVRETLAGLEARLDPGRFLRIHRGTIVRLDTIREMEPLFRGEYRLRLAGGARVRSSRRHRAELHRALGLDG